MSTRDDMDQGGDVGAEVAAVVACKVPDCDKSPQGGRAMCPMHSNRYYKHGDVNAAGNGQCLPPQERFWSKVDKSGECWLWTGALVTGGYAQFKLDGSIQQAHRVSYEWLVGPIPDGLHLDHLCRTRNCVNPAHLEPVTPRVNTLRGESFAALHAAKTHCLRGHEFTPENTRPTKTGGRECRACVAIRGAKAYARRKANA